MPQQLGFQQNGCEMVPMIVQLHLEQDSEHAAMKLDNETWALSLVAIIAMSDRTLLTLLTSHARCWIVGSLPYLLCVASEQSTIGHCNDGDQTQRPGH
jgi:hypothetical protein